MSEYTITEAQRAQLLAIAHRTASKYRHNHAPDKLPVYEFLPHHLIDFFERACADLAGGLSGVVQTAPTDEAMRIAFEQDARTTSRGEYRNIDLSTTRMGNGYINPAWDADWQIWKRAWNAAAGVQVAPPAPPAEPDMRAICEALGFDPTNHHNAAKCPYCRPTAAIEVPPAQPATELLRELVEAHAEWDAMHWSQRKPDRLLAARQKAREYVAAIEVPTAVQRTPCLHSYTKHDWREGLGYWQCKRCGIVSQSGQESACTTREVPRDAGTDSEVKP